MANPDGEVRPVGADVGGLAGKCRNSGGDVVSLGAEVGSLGGEVAKPGEEIENPGGDVARLGEEAGYLDGQGCSLGVERANPGLDVVQVPMNLKRPGGSVVDRPAGGADQAATGSGTVRVPRGPGKRWRRSSYTSCAPSRPRWAASRTLW